MTWEDKTHLCQLANLGDQKSFIEFAKKMNGHFDLQSWDMFITGIELTLGNVKKHIEPLVHIMNQFDMQKELGFKSSMRIELLNLLIEEEINKL